MRPALLLLITLASCGLADAPGEPWVEAHRGAAGYWPQNSRTAMLGSLEAGYDGIELDLVLTSDQVPVLAHDPWVHTELCTTADGQALTEQIPIDGLSLAELQSDFLCGGVPDEAWPQAEVVADTVMTLDELLLELHDHPDVIVHLDVKQDPEWTTDADTYAAAILDRWWEADLDNPWYVSSAFPEVTRAFEAYGDQAGEDVITSLSWPAFPHGSSSAVIGVGAELGMSLGTTELVYQARQAQADALALPYAMADWRRVRDVRSQGLMVMLWTLNSEALLRRYHEWPVDALITDIPEEAP